MDRGRLVVDPDALPELDALSKPQIEKTLLHMTADGCGDARICRIEDVQLTVRVQERVAVPARCRDGATAL